MPSAFRRFTENIFIITNLVTAFLFILACISPYLHPGKYWLLGLLTLGFPILFFILLAFFVFWLIVKPRRSFISLIVLLLGWKTTIETFGFTLRGNKTNDGDAVKVMNWNVHMFDYYI